MKNSFKDILFQAVADINDLCTYKITENLKMGSWRIELYPKNEYGRESICLAVYDNHISLSYDYYEKRYDYSLGTFENTAKIVVDVVAKILEEKLLALTTYSHNINATRVSDLYSPSESKKIRRRKNFRARSWQGTFDDDYPSNV